MGKVIIFSAPSGAGKSTIVNFLLEKYPQLEFSISATSRLPRGTEKHGVEYYFYPTAEFKNKIELEELLEWEEVYAGCYYGTLKNEVERIWKKGHTVVFDVDVMGGINLKKKFGDNALSIFIMPPSVKTLKARLQSRGTDSTEKIEERVAKAEYEISFANQFDKIIINDQLEMALAEAEKMIQEFL